MVNRWAYGLLEHGPNSANSITMPNLIQKQYTSDQMYCVLQASLWNCEDYILPFIFNINCEFLILTHDSGQLYGHIPVVSFSKSRCSCTKGLHLFSTARQPLMPVIF